MGIGNDLRRDDGIGPAVAAQIQRREIPGVQIIYAVGVCDVTIGQGLSAPVAATVPVLVDVALGELGRMDAS